MADWAYFERTRENYGDIFKSESKLIYWFGGQLKSANEISYYESRGRNLLTLDEKSLSNLEGNIFDLIPTNTYSQEEKSIIRKNIRMEINRANAILKLLEAFTPSRRLFDIGAGCGIINYVFQHTKTELKDVVSCDQIEFSQESFFELNNNFSAEKKKFLYQDDIFNFKSYEISDVPVFRWSFDEFDDGSKAKIIKLIEAQKFNHILVCGAKHSNEKTDIDHELVSLGYTPIFCGRKPFDHGFIRLYEKRPKRLESLHRILSFMRLFPGKKNKWWERILKWYSEN